jgi:hypothetical protein
MKDVGAGFEHGIGYKIFCSRKRATPATVKVSAAAFLTAQVLDQLIK